MIDFGQQLRQLRLQFGMSTQDLAQASALTEATIESLESGQHVAWPSTRRSLARAFRMPLEEFERWIAEHSAAGQTTVSVIQGSDEAPANPLMVKPEASQSIEDSGRQVHAVEPPSLAPSPTASAGGLQYAPAKVMELLNRLGELESELHQYRTFIREVCAACWTTDAALRLINVIGPPSADLARVNFCQRHISEYFERAWGEESADLTPLLMHQRAADGHSVSFHLEISATRYAVYVDPRRDATGKVVGTVGAAIDITYRESANAGV